MTMRDVSTLIHVGCYSVHELNINIGMLFALMLAYPTILHMSKLIEENVLTFFI